MSAKNLDEILDDNTHSDTGASGMDRWEPCPGSVALCAKMPPSSSSYSEEGTLAHSWGEIKIKNSLHGTNVAPPNGVEDFHDMEDSVDVYVDHVLTIWENLKPHNMSKISLELKFSHPEIHKGFRGTADCVIYDGANKILYVIDYKHGAGVPVEAENNSQLSYYGIGAALKFKGLPIDRAILQIVQPRYSAEEAIKSWEIDTVDLMGFLDRIVTGIEATEKKDALLVVGDKQCMWCRAKPICPALKRKAALSAQADFAEDKLPELGPEKLGLLLANVEVIETWCKSIKSFAYSEAKQNRIPFGYKLVPKRATRKWADPAQAEKILGGKLNSNLLRDIYTDPELKSPAQVEKIIGGKAGKEIVEELVVAISSGDTLAPLDDNRPAINREEMARQLFSEN